jgi:divalent metal cation (Fe/Co/Zn/Cd) transporter
MGFPYMDPIAGGLVGLMIAHTGGEMVWQSVADLTDTVNADEIRELERIINRCDLPL